MSIRDERFPTQYSKFEEPQFIANNIDDFLLYIDYRVRGYSGSMSLRRVFGELNADQNMLKRIDAIESTRWYRAAFDKRLKDIAIEEMWDTKQSLHELLCLTRNPVFKESVRLNALKELNVMCGIVVVDESGKSRKGTSLADFYATATTPGQESTAKH